MSNNITQIAVCTTDFYRSIVFYDQVVGMDTIFGTVAFRGQIAETIQQLPNPASKVRWLIDDSARFQLEIFEFEQPQPKPLPGDYGIRYQGYNHLIIAVESIERFQKDMYLLGFYQALNVVDGAHGRQAVTTDPDGIPLQLVEQRGLISGNRHAQLIGLGLTTNQFETCLGDFVDTLGLTSTEDLFDTSQVWSSQAELSNAATLQLDGKYLVVCGSADSKPRANYRLCDAGIMNFALGYTEFADWKEAINKGQKAGISFSVVPGDSSSREGIGGTYATGNTGLSIEMVYCDAAQLGGWGWAVPSDADRDSMYEFSKNQIAGYNPAGSDT